MSFDDKTTVDKNLLEIIGCNHNQKTTYIMMYKEIDSNRHVVSISNYQIEHGVTNKTKIPPTSEEYKTTEQIQKRLQETRMLQDSDNMVLPCKW